jgi:hypothetical protein
MINEKVEHNKEISKSYLVQDNKTVVEVNEYYNLEFGLFHFISFELIIFQSVAGKSFIISFNINFQIDYKYKKGDKELKGKLKGTPWKVKYERGEKETNGKFFFTEQNIDDEGLKDVYDNSEPTLEQIEQTIVILMGAVYDYMIDNPPVKEESRGRKYWKNLKHELVSPQFMLMVYNNEAV